MQDSRIRTGVMVYLSLCAMLSVYAALYAFFWWIVCSGRTQNNKTLYNLVWIFLFTGIITLLTWYTGGDAISYFIRITTVFLIATWAYQYQKDGDLLDVSVWIGGNQLGFELGLIAEMTLGTIRIIREDVTQIRTAMYLKGQKLTISSLSAIVSLELFTLLARAMQQGDLLQSRGYKKGGTYTPEFVTGSLDVVFGVLAIPAGFLLFIPVQDIFKYLLPYLCSYHF